MMIMMIMMNKIIIIYNANINQIDLFNHIGDYNELLAVDSKEFYSIPDAIEFLDKCSEPITKLSDILSNEVPLEVIDYSVTSNLANLWETNYYEDYQFDQL